MNCSLCFALLLVSVAFTLAVNDLDNNWQDKEPEEEHGDLFESDIKLTVTQLEMLNDAKIAANDPEGRKAVVSVAKLWPDARVPYILHSTLTSIGVEGIRDAIAHWETHTCLKFEEHTSPSAGVLAHLVIFFQGDGCWSELGRSNFALQPISIGEGCERMGIVAHEIGHTIGFWHEQSRLDRDNYITVQYENILTGMEHNFDKYDVGQGQTYGVPYDLDSMMHYGAYFFSSNGKKTIRTLDPALQDRIGSHNSMSFLDFKLANIMYQCNANCPSLTCVHEGYVGPDCLCVCPDGYSGALCQTPTIPSENGCGAHLTSSSGIIQSPNYPCNYTLNIRCSWLIEVPVGKLVSVTFDDFEIESSPPGTECIYDFIAFRTEANFYDGGILHCGSTLPDCFTSTSNKLVVQFSSDVSVALRGFKLRYSAINGHESCDDV